MKLIYCMLSFFTTSTALKSSNFHQSCGTNLNGNIISSSQTSSKIKCASYCLHTDSCGGVKVNQTELLSTGSVTCFLLTNIAVTEQAPNNDVCVLVKEGAFITVTSTVAETTETLLGSTSEGLTLKSTEFLTTDASIDTTVNFGTTEKTTSNQPSNTIIGAVEGLKNKCSLNSGYDIGVLTLDGVYVFENFASLSQQPCLAVQVLGDIFPAASLPAITDVDAIMTHQNDFIEIFANNQVWRWLMNVNPASLQSGFPKSLSDHLLSSTVPSNYDLTGKLFTSAKWGTNREKYGGIMRYFYTNSDTIVYYYSIVPEYVEFTPNQGTIPTQNNQNINIWSQLPPDVADVCRDPENIENYIVFTHDGNHHKYAVDYSIDSNNPSVSITNHGSVKY